jgi:hypothetical protein
VVHSVSRFRREKPNRGYKVRAVRIASSCFLDETLEAKLIQPSHEETPVRLSRRMKALLEAVSNRKGEVWWRDWQLRVVHSLLGMCLQDND